MGCGCSAVADSSRILFTCSGCCAEGAAADKIGRMLRQAGYARCGGSCLAGVSAGYPKFLNAAKAANEVVAIDGCGMRCASVTLKKAQIASTAYVLTERGFTPGQAEEAFIASFVENLCANDMNQEIKPACSQCD